jgi:hypothetical protein
MHHAKFFGTYVPTWLQDLGFGQSACLYLSLFLLLFLPQVNTRIKSQHENPHLPRVSRQMRRHVERIG